MRLRYAPRFYLLLAKCKGEIAEITNQRHASLYFSNLIDKLNELKAHPERYPPCKNSSLSKIGCRCFTYKKTYLVVYKIQEDTINVLAIIYARKNPNNFLKITLGIDK